MHSRQIAAGGKKNDAMIQQVQTDVMNTVDKHRAQQQYSANLSRISMDHNKSIFEHSMNHSKSMPLPTYQMNSKIEHKFVDDYQTSTMSRRQKAVENIKQERKIKMKLHESKRN